MHHGTATSRVTIEGIVQEGESGIITAYLPQDPVHEPTFGVFFGEGRWHTFHMDEQAFHESFHVELDDPTMCTLRNIPSCPIV